MLTGENGILGKATTAKAKSAEEEARERVNLMLADWKMENAINSDIMLDYYLTSTSGKYYEEIKSFGIEQPIDKVNEEQYYATVYIDGSGYDVLIELNQNKEPIIKKIEKVGRRIRVKNTKIIKKTGETEEIPNDYTIGNDEKLYINFEASIENGEITKVTPNIPYEVDSNGKVEFEIIGNVNGEECQRKYIVEVKKYTLKQGSWINYKAGNWSKEEIQALETEGLYAGYEEGNCTTNNYGKFWGFKEGDSKDNTINDRNNNVNKYKSGWRVLNTNSDGSINIVHAGTPEVYIGQWIVYSNYGAISENILSSGTRQNEANDGSYPVRFWQNYVNKQYADSAHCLTRDETNLMSDDLRNIGVVYYYANCGLSYELNGVYANGSIGAPDAWGNIYNGIRPVVTLKKDIKIAGGTGAQDDPYRIEI